MGRPPRSEPAEPGGSFSPLLIGSLAGGAFDGGARPGGGTFSPLLIGSLAGGPPRLRPVATPSAFQSPTHRESSWWPASVDGCTHRETDFQSPTHRESSWWEAERRPLLGLLDGFQSPTHRESSWWGEMWRERLRVESTFSPLLIGSLAGGEVVLVRWDEGDVTFSPLLIGSLAGGSMTATPRTGSDTFSPLLIGSLAGGTATASSSSAWSTSFSPLLIGSLAGGSHAQRRLMRKLILSVPYSSGV